MHGPNAASPTKRMEWAVAASLSALDSLLPGGADHKPHDVHHEIHPTARLCPGAGARLGEPGEVTAARLGQPGPTRLALRQTTNNVCTYVGTRAGLALNGARSAQRNVSQRPTTPRVRSKLNESRRCARFAPSCPSCRRAAPTGPCHQQATTQVILGSPPHTVAGNRRGPSGPTRCMQPSYSGAREDNCVATSTSRRRPPPSSALVPLATRQQPRRPRARTAANSGTYETNLGHETGRARKWVRVAPRGTIRARGSVRGTARGPVFSTGCWRVRETVCWARQQRRLLERLSRQNRLLVARTRLSWKRQKRWGPVSSGLYSGHKESVTVSHTSTVRSVVVFAIQYL